jgi:hypothetical protein
MRKHENSSKPSMSAMAFHEKAGPGQVDFDLPFLKFPFPSWREGVQSGPERSRARCLRRSEPLTARTALSPFRQEGKGAVVLDLSILPRFLLCAPTNPVATLPSALFGERWIRSVQVGCSRCSRCCHLLVDLSAISRWKLGQGHRRSHRNSALGRAASNSINLNYAAAGNTTGRLVRSGS